MRVRHMNPEDIKLPDDELILINLYHFFQDRIDKVWYEYQSHIASISNLPKTNLIFPIIFSELDFYDCVLARITSKLLPETLKEVQYDRNLRNG